MKAHGLFRTVVSFLLDFQSCFHVMRTLFFFTGDTVTESTDSYRVIGPQIAFDATKIGHSIILLH